MTSTTPTSRLPRHTGVVINNPDDEWHSYTAFVHHRAGETTTDGDPIPDGWVEVIFDPMDTDGYHTELYRVSNLDIYC